MREIFIVVHSPLPIQSAKEMFYCYSSRRGNILNNVNKKCVNPFFRGYKNTATKNQHSGVVFGRASVDLYYIIVT